MRGTVLPLRERWSSKGMHGHNYLKAECSDGARDEFKRTYKRMRFLLTRRITESLAENRLFGVGLDFKVQSWGEAHGGRSGPCASLSSAVMMPGLQNLPQTQILAQW